jgi:hypothetical protein
MDTVRTNFSQEILLQGYAVQTALGLMDQVERGACATIDFRC